MMYGNIFLRPFETYHVTTRKFLEQELFKSDQHEGTEYTMKFFYQSLKSQMAN